MVSFAFKVKSEKGLHARPAGALVKEAIKCSGTVTIRKGDKQEDLKRVYNVMSLAIKENEEVEITVEGKNEEAEAAALQKYINENLQAAAKP